MGAVECAFVSTRSCESAWQTWSLRYELSRSEGTAASTQPWRFLGVDPEIYIFEVASGLFWEFCFLVSDVLAEARTGVESRHGIDRHLEKSGGLPLAVVKSGRLP